MIAKYSNVLSVTLIVIAGLYCGLPLNSLEEDGAVEVNAFSAGYRAEYQFRMYDPSISVDTLEGSMSVFVSGTEVIENRVYDVHLYRTVYSKTSGAVRFDSVHTYKQYIARDDSFFISHAYTPTGYSVSLAKKSAEPRVTVNSLGEKVYIEQVRVVSFPQYLYVGNSWTIRPRYSGAEIVDVVGIGSEAEFRIRVSPLDGNSFLIRNGVRYDYTITADENGVSEISIVLPAYFYEARRTDVSTESFAD
ncbi:MAG: hypothetical protein ACLFVQ_08475 [Chitinispirillaceae bacterium]